MYDQVAMLHPAAVAIHPDLPSSAVAIEILTDAARTSLHKRRLRSLVTSSATLKIGFAWSSWKLSYNQNIIVPRHLAILTMQLSLRKCIHVYLR